MRCIDHVGFDLVRSRVIPTSDCDTALRVAFGSGLEATKESVTHCLLSYTEHLRNETGPLLVDDDYRFGTT